MTSPRARLLASFVTCLQSITLANGYHTNAGQWVTTEPGQVDTAAPGALAVVIDRQARAERSGFANSHRLTEVLVIAKVPAAMGEVQAGLDSLLSDIERAVESQLALFSNNNAEPPQYVEMQPIPPAANEPWTGAAIRYRCHIPIRGDA